MKRMSILERAAHEDSIKQLLEMFPAWSESDMEALFSSCGDKMDATVEEIMRLGEEGASEAAAAAFSGMAAPGGGASSSPEAVDVDLRSAMSRQQVARPARFFASLPPLPPCLRVSSAFLL